MLAASDLLKQASRFSQTLSLRADITRGPTVVKAGIPVVNGDLNSDRTSQTRHDGKLELAMWPWELTGIDAYTCRVNIYRGVESLGIKEVLQIASLRIDEIDRAPGGRVSLSCSGLENYIVDARFIVPRTPPRGSSTTATISSLIREVLPTITVRNEVTTNRLITAVAPWDLERMDAVDLLSSSINAETFADAKGQFVIKDIPSLLTGTPVITLNEGDYGLLVDTADKDTRDQVYNAASVSGMSTDPDTPPVWGWAYVSDPLDPLYYYGEFGQVPIFHTSQFYTTDAQCTAYAGTLLAIARAKNASLSFTTPTTLWWLEVGDLVQVARADGTTEVHLLQKMKGGLGVDGGIKFDTLATKVATRLGI